ncbi:hypothetical protein PIB30_075650 [Stylosanthes scabra]|uniref:Uncharacterized protein n=1 Tax=Stylosanthes scabra TaxID=79078 RepID=A0ABU6YNY6_9FABA|nr:hypothetical protein [Stylosanthes scabra]
MRMIPTPGSMVQSSETTGTRSQHPIPTQTTTGSEEPPPPEPEPMPWPPINNPLSEGEEEDIAMEEELARQAGRVYLRWDGSNWHFFDCSAATSLHLGVMADEGRQETPRDDPRDPQQGAPRGWIQDDLWDRLVEFWRQEDYKKLKQTNKKNRASETGGSLHTGGSTMYEATRERMALELRRPPTQSKIFARTHTWKEDQLWVDRRSEDANELKRLQTERQAIIDAGGPESLAIDEDAVWTRIAGGSKRGRIYGKGVVPSHKYPALFGDPDDDDTANGPLDLREELTQQAETHSQQVAAVEAVYSEKVWRLESTMQAQSQEVSDLRKAYSDLYSYLSHIRSGSSSSGMPDMPPPPPPPPPARSQDLPPQPDQSTGSPQPEDDPDYI